MFYMVERTESIFYVDDPSDHFISVEIIKKKVLKYYNTYFLPKVFMLLAPEKRLRRQVYL